MDGDWTAESRRVSDDFRFERVSLIAPDLLRHEFASAILNATRPAAGSKRMQLTDGKAVIDRLLSLGIRFIDAGVLTPRAFELATRISCSHYDTIFLATSVATSTPLVYADRRLRNASRDRIPLTIWIEDDVQAMGS